MLWKSGLLGLAVACGLGLLVVQTVRAQEGPPGKVVYGMFGPRVLGQPLQSPVQRADRGIARDAYGNFLGVNRAYSGRRFPEPGVRPSAPSLPTPIPAEPEPMVEPPAAPDEWLRTEGAMTNPLVPVPWSIEEEQPGSVTARGEQVNADHSPPRKAAAVLVASDGQVNDLFAGRIAARLERMPQIVKRSPIRVVMRGETAILRGRVASRHDRELAENVVRMEPGVWDVRNELVVEESSQIAGARVAGPSQP